MIDITLSKENQTYIQKQVEAGTPVDRIIDQALTQWRLTTETTSTTPISQGSTPTKRPRAKNQPSEPVVLLDRLREAGLVASARPPKPGEFASNGLDPIEILGKPLSHTILDDRR